MGKLIQGSLTGTQAVAKIESLPKSIKSSIVGYEEGVYNISEEIIEKTVTSWQGNTVKSVQVVATIGDGKDKQVVSFPLSCFRPDEPIYANSNLDLIDSATNSGGREYIDAYNAIKNQKFRLHHVYGYRRSLKKGTLYRGQFSYWTKEE